MHWILGQYCGFLHTSLCSTPAQFTLDLNACWPGMLPAQSGSHGAHLCTSKFTCMQKLENLKALEPQVRLSSSCAVVALSWLALCTGSSLCRLVSRGRPIGRRHHTARKLAGFHGRGGRQDVESSWGSPGSGCRRSRLSVSAETCAVIVVCIFRNSAISPPCFQAHRARCI